MTKEVNTRAIEAELARKHELTIKEVHLATSSQFSLVRKIMGEGKFESIRLPFFGRFWVKPNRKLAVDLMRRRKLRREAKENKAH